MSKPRFWKVVQPFPSQHVKDLEFGIWYPKNVIYGLIFF